LAALAVRERFAEQHPEYLETLNRIGRGDIATLSGDFDQVEKVLDCLRVPVTVNPNVERTRAKMVFANCSGSCKTGVPKTLARRVQEGMWLASSDWALHHVLEPAFPGMVRWTKRTTGSQVVSVEPHLDSLWS